MKSFFYRDPNGTIPSDDGKVMYSCIKGKQIHEFFKNEENRKRRFIKATAEDDTDEMWFEVDTVFVREARKEERREQYVSDEKRKSGIQFVSLESTFWPEDSEEALILKDVISDGIASPEDEFMKKSDKHDLYTAIRQLPTSERELLYAFYFMHSPMTERQYSSLHNVPQQTVHNRKKAAIKKLKKILEDNGSN